MMLSLWSNKCRLMVALVIAFATSAIFFTHTSQESIEIVPKSPRTAKWLTNNALECVPKENIGFLKTHKCASSAVQNILLRFGYNHNLNFAIPEKKNYFGGGTNSFTASMVKDTPWYKLGVNIFAVHTKWNHKEMMSLMPEDTVYLTIVREPAELFESLFSFFNFNGVYRQNISQFVQNHDKGTKRYNGYVGYNQIAWDAGLSFQHMDNENAALELAKAMEKQFGLVMVAERMEESLVLMSRLLCWNLTDVLVLKINSRAQKFKKSMDERTRNLLKEKLSLDYIIYNYFVKLFDETVEAYGKEQMERDVAELRKATERLMESCGFVDKDRGALTGADKPSNFMVLGYEPKIQDEKCKQFSMTELNFVEMIRKKQMEM